jgi:hypothetical protein
MVKRKILIITTKNCLGCTIQSNNVQAAIAKSNYAIQLDIKDFQEDSRVKKIIYNNRIYDFPATVFIKDDKVQFVSIGSNPRVVIERFIKVHLV